MLCPFKTDDWGYCHRCGSLGLSPESWWVSPLVEGCHHGDKPIKPYKLHLIGYKSPDIKVYMLNKYSRQDCDQPNSSLVSLCFWSTWNTQRSPQIVQLQPVQQRNCSWIFILSFFIHKYTPVCQHTCAWLCTSLIHDDICRDYQYLMVSACCLAQKGRLAWACLRCITLCHDWPCRGCVEHPVELLLLVKR